jgi:hypothetical protein
MQKKSNNNSKSEREDMRTIEVGAGNYIDAAEEA